MRWHLRDIRQIVNGIILMPLDAAQRLAVQIAQFSSLRYTDSFTSTQINL